MVPAGHGNTQLVELSRQKKTISEEFSRTRDPADYLPEESRGQNHRKTRGDLVSRRQEEPGLRGSQSALGRREAIANVDQSDVVSRAALMRQANIEISYSISFT